MKGERNNRKQHLKNRKQISKRILLQSVKGDRKNATSPLAKTSDLRKAAHLRIERQFTQDVPAVWMEDGIIYKFYPDGRKEKLGSAKRSATKLSQRRFYIQK